MRIDTFEGRKREHIQYALDPAHQAAGLSGLDQIHLHHDALPEIDFEEVRLDSVFFVPGMTAGHPDAPQINRTLAEVCQQQGWAMGVGSQRRELEADSTIDRWKEVRKSAPKLELFANIGLSQILDAPVSGLQRLVDAIEASALVIHLNPLQESIQLEGTPRFKNGLRAIERVIQQISVPVVLKETGCGFSAQALNKIRELNLKAVDVSGLGGTHWGRIEGARAGNAQLPEGETWEGQLRSQAALTFAKWGESTVDSVLCAREILRKGPSGVEVWASGGVRSGLDAAKLIALGSDRVGFAKPALEAALQGADVLVSWMRQQEFELRVALFCTGCASPRQLREKEGMWKKKSGS